MQILLAIESSCDDTAAAVIQNGKVLSNIVSSQHIHEAFGGVVPELASRAHQSKIVPVVDLALQKAGVGKKELDAVAFTQGPGLLGSLMVGTSFAKSMALALDIPLIAVNHLQAHLAAHFIEEPKPEFPFLCLLVSGGHTMLVKMENELDYSIIGQTTDDAAGEAFDKAAKLLGLPYPGGPLIDKYAEEGNPKRFSFSKPVMTGLDFSFSGIKTSLLYFIRDETHKNSDFVKANLNDICASYQFHIVSYLIEQLEKTAKQTGIKEIGIAGGVAANSLLRQMVKETAEKKRWRIFIPAFEYCTDNAAMVAMAAWFKYKAGEFSEQDVAPYAKG